MFSFALSVIPVISLIVFIIAFQATVNFSELNMEKSYHFINNASSINWKQIVIHFIFKENKLRDFKPHGCFFPFCMLTIIVFFVIKFQLKIRILATPVTNSTLWWLELCYGKFTLQQILNHLRIDWMRNDGCSNWNCVVLCSVSLWYAMWKYTRIKQ